MDSDTVYVHYYSLADDFRSTPVLKDTIISKDNTFVYDAPIADPVFAIFYPSMIKFTSSKGKPYYPNLQNFPLLITPKDKIKITGKPHKTYIAYDVTGSKFNTALIEHRSSYAKALSELRKQFYCTDWKEDKAQAAAVRKQMDSINAALYRKQIKYIKENPNDDLSAYYLLEQRSIDTIAKYYSFLGNKAKNGMFKKELDFRYNAYTRNKKVKKAEALVVEGTNAPEFTLKTISGKDLALTSIQANYVVLDFWGSWCGWCIKGFPKMKEYYAKYKGRVEIVGIACKDEDAKWRKSVQENELKWINVINSDEEDKDLRLIYGVNVYPTKIILDKDKKIIGRFMGELLDKICKWY